MGRMGLENFADRRGIERGIPMPSGRHLSKARPIVWLHMSSKAIPKVAKTSYFMPRWTPRSSDVACGMMSGQTWSVVVQFQSMLLSR